MDENTQNGDYCPHGKTWDEICGKCDDDKLEHEQREWERQHWLRQLRELPR